MPYLKWRRPDLKVKTSGKSSIFRLKIHICKLKMHICNLKIYICRLKIELSSEVSNFSSDVNRFPLGIKKQRHKGMRSIAYYLRVSVYKVYVPLLYGNADHQMVFRNLFASMDIYLLHYTRNRSYHTVQHLHSLMNQ